MPQNYDETEVQRWAEEIETVLEAGLKEAENTAAEESLEQVRRHYNQGVDLWEGQGLSEEACYEFEVAYNLLDRVKQDFYLEVESADHDF